MDSPENHWSIDQSESNEKMITDKNEGAEACNEHFVAICERLVSQILYSSHSSIYHISNSLSKFEFNPFTEAQVLKVINKLVNSKVTSFLD